MLELEELIVCKVVLVIVCHGGEIKMGCIQGMGLDIFVSAQTCDLAKRLSIVFLEKWQKGQGTHSTKYSLDMIYTGHLLKIDDLIYVIILPRVMGGMSYSLPSGKETRFRHQ